MNHVDRRLTINACPEAIVVIPTYNESANILALLAELMTLTPAVSVLVVDDSSPDGTAELVQWFRPHFPDRIHLLRRSRKLGLGTAYVEGFQHARGLGTFRCVLQMDADFSHPPHMVPLLLEASRNADVVVGSRFAPGGSTPGFERERELLSRAASLLIRTVLGLQLHDPTGGMKCFRRSALERIDLSLIRSRGFAFQVEMNWLCDRLGMSIAEVPIRFEPRRAGCSKMSAAVIYEALMLVGKLRSAAFPSPPDLAVRRTPAVVTEDSAALR